MMNFLTAMPPLEKESWPNDGTLHHDVRPEALFRNAAVEEFLNFDRRTILISSKGMGKTLLLRAKKRKLEEDAVGYRIIPRDAEYDEPRIAGDLPLGGYDDLDFWNNIWQASIIFSILTHDGERAGAQIPGGVATYIDRLDIDEEFRTKIKSDIKERRQHVPSYYLGELLRRSLSAAQRFTRSHHVTQQMSGHFIKSGCCVFIDGFDQMLERHFTDDLEAWKNAQLGLLTAIHQLNTHNAHIKVYASIRQEAFAGFTRPDREVIKSKSVILVYTEEELRKMFLLAVQRYTSHRSIAEFFGAEKVCNQYHGCDEDPFSYLYRHSTGTPRSIMGFGHELSLAELSKHPAPDAQKILRKVVNKVATENVFHDYFKTQRQFLLKTLREDPRITTLFSLIPTNVLRSEDLKRINTEFALRDLTLTDGHPFCELFNVGLLGHVTTDPASGEELQSFKKPYSFEWRQGEIVKPGRTYFLHPGLHNAVFNENPKYAVNRKVLIGDGSPWDSKKPLFPLLFVSHSSSDKPFINEFLPQFTSCMSLLCPVAAWYDEQSLKVGSRIVDGLEQGIKESEVVLVFISKQSLASNWVNREWSAKHDLEITSGRTQVMCIIIDDTPVKDLPPFLASKKAIYLPSKAHPSYPAQMEKLCNDLADHLRTSSFYQSS
jgi:hypothetical protein